MIYAYYTTRRGAGGVRTILTAAEAEKILKGGYGVLDVVLRDGQHGEIIGERTKRYDNTERGEWFWTYDQEYFDK